jgi:2-oxoisovalerate dehydrogenase E2 component (dihydrolipoyl transacylase)
MSMKRMMGIQNITLPDLGEGTKEATIKEIYVKVGDIVEEYDDLCEVFTDKLVAKIPSSASGRITAINYGDDDICKVGHAIMTIEDDEAE